jgi:hypothetical protein
LFGKAKSTISEHIKAIFEESELDEEVVVRKFRTTTKHGAIEGKTQSKEVNFYSLDMIIASTSFSPFQNINSTSSAIFKPIVGIMFT